MASYHGQLPYNGGYSGQAYHDGSGYNSQQAYGDPYAYSQHQPYPSTNNDHYPPTPAADPYGQHANEDGTRGGYGAYPSTQTLDEKGSSYSNLGGGTDDQYPAAGEPEPKRREGVFRNAEARQSRGSVAAQVSAFQKQRCRV